MRRVEVRCCCTPIKLLGTLPMPDGADSFNFPVMRPRNDDFRRAAAEPLERRSITLRMQAWTARAEIVNVDDPRGVRIQQVASGVALKADGIPIETLRLIPGFIEHKEST